MVVNFFKKKIDIVCFRPKISLSNLWFLHLSPVPYKINMVTHSIIIKRAFSISSHFLISKSKSFNAVFEKETYILI